MGIVFFIAVKLAGYLLKVETWLPLPAIVDYWATRRQRLSLTKGTSAALVIRLLFIGFLPVGDLALRPIKYEVLDVLDPERIDSIIVLGGSEDVAASITSRRTQTRKGGDRYLATIALARRFPEARIVFAGGSGRLRDVARAKVSEAGIAGVFFAHVGIEPNRLLLENRSRNTAEKARLSFELAQPEPDEAWVLVTGAFHVPRALRSFVEAGWEGILPFAVDYRTRSVPNAIRWDLVRDFSRLNKALKEWAGSAAYSATGR